MTCFKLCWLNYAVKAFFSRTNKPSNLSFSLLLCSNVKVFVSPLHITTQIPLKYLAYLSLDVEHILHDLYIPPQICCIDDLNFK